MCIWDPMYQGNTHTSRLPKKLWQGWCTWRRQTRRFPHTEADCPANSAPLPITMHLWLADSQAPQWRWCHHGWDRFDGRERNNWHLKSYPCKSFIVNTVSQDNEWVPDKNTHTWSLQLPSHDNINVARQSKVFPKPEKLKEYDPKPSKALNSCHTSSSL